MGSGDVPLGGLDGTGERASPMSEQEALDHLVWQGTAVHVHQLAHARAALMNVPGKQLLPRASGTNQEDRQARGGETLDQLRRTFDRRRFADDRREQPGHCKPLRFSRGAVTLSASASVVRMRGVRNKYNSVLLTFRSALPNSPPRMGIPDRIGTPPWVTSFS